MRELLSTDEVNEDHKRYLIRSGLFFLGIISILIFLWVKSPYQFDPYITETLVKDGSSTRGHDLFKVNCVGCHGISAQGLVGPDLHEVTTQLSDKKIINQVVKGLTPPMPSFEIDQQSMADLLAYIHSLN